MSTTKMVRRVLRLPAVKAKVGLSHDAIYRGMREGWFPKSISLTPTKPGSDRAPAVGWLEHELDAYLAGRAAARDARVSA